MAICCISALCTLPANLHIRSYELCKRLIDKEEDFLLKLFNEEEY